MITAGVNGIIGDINITESSEITQGTSSGNVSSSGSTSSVQMSAKTGRLLFLTANIGTKEETPEKAEQKDSPQLTVIKDYSELTIQAPVTGEIPQKTITETNTYNGTITWNCNDETFQAISEYAAVIVLTAKFGYTFSKENLPDIANAKAEYEILDAGSVLEITAKYEKTAEMQQPSGEQASNVQTTGNQNTNPAGTHSYVSGVSTGQDSASAEYNNNYEVTVFTIQKQDNVKVSVNVDELDILSVKEGQTAKITLDALEGEEYEGTITKVENSASGGNGSTKYEVEITIPMNENMRIGMSASASVQVSEASDVLTIPMTALQQRGEETFVYTEKDDEGNLTGEVSVETGLSDRQSVEIVSGLEEGDTVYYTRTGESSSEESGFGGGMPPSN